MNSHSLRQMAIAEPLNPAVDVSQHVKRVKAEVSHGMRRLIARGDRPHWMSARTMSTARQIFARTLNGIGATDIDFDVDGGVISIDPPTAVWRRHGRNSRDKRVGCGRVFTRAPSVWRN